MWPEKTDPLKYVYEDIAIATYLIVLWKKSSRNCQPKFVDLGCGNGLLVHILNSEGFVGFGIDVRKRKIWDLYPDSTVLEIKTISPSSSCLFPDVDWIIGNHSDELTPWIPVIAARSSYKANFFLLPCCCYEFSGQKYVRRNTNISSYSEYLYYICNIAEQCGFIIRKDKLRIPSTKRTCLISVSRNYKPEEFNGIDKTISNLISETYLAKSPMWTNNFQARSPIELVRNCTQLDRNFVNNIVKIVFSKLLLEKCIVTKINGELWNKGGLFLLSKIASDMSEDLKLLKNENGGLQTLLKNHRYIFELKKGIVNIRVPQTAKETNNKYKNKLCWFNLNHPEGCFNDSDECAYKH